MASNNDPALKHGGSGGDGLEHRVAAVESRLTAVESRLGIIEKTMVTAEVFQREIGALRDEMHTGLGGLRDEMHVAIGALRQEMHVELGAVRVEIAKIPFELVKWLIALAGIAVAIATAIYNIWFR